jgi:hypothetical protein
MEMRETLQAIDDLGAKLKELSEQHRHAMVSVDIALVNRIQAQIGDLTRQKELLIMDFQNKRS